MLYNKVIYEPVESRFSAKRARNRCKVDARREEIYQKLPEIREMDRQIEQTGLSLFHLTLNGEMDAERAVAEIKDKNDRLIARKNKLLLEAGYPADYLQNVYDCPKCKDTGYIEGRICDCFYRELVKEAGSRSNLGASMRKSSFDQFQIEFYPDKSDNEGNNPRTQMHFILDCCYGFMRHFGEEENKNLLFYGSTGLGKTFLTAAISNELIEKGYTVMYYSARELFSMLTDNEFQQNQVLRDSCKWAYGVDLLVIDDLGSEHITTYTVASFFDILNARLLSGKQMILNTNLSMSDLNTIYSSRIFSRLTEFEILKFLGNDIRVLKNHG